MNLGFWTYHLLSTCLLSIFERNSLVLTGCLELATLLRRVKNSFLLILDSLLIPFPAKSSIWFLHLFYSATCRWRSNRWFWSYFWLPVLKLDLYSTFLGGLIRFWGFFLLLWSVPAKISEDVAAVAIWAFDTSYYWVFVCRWCATGFRSSFNCWTRLFITASN